MGPKIFLQVLPQIDVIRCLKVSLYAISRKTNKLNKKNGKKPSLGLDFGTLAKFRCQNFFLWILALTDVRHCCKLSFYTVSRKTNEPNLWKSQKTWILVQFWPIWPKFRPPKYFFKNLASLITSYHVQLPSCTISEKSNDPILRKVSGRQTDGQTDNSGFIGRCLTNVKHPIMRWLNLIAKTMKIKSRSNFYVLLHTTQALI